MLMCMSQLRHVERLLRTLYRETAQMEYHVDGGIPAGFMRQIDRGDKRTKRRSRWSTIAFTSTDANDTAAI
jgi:hypothetical protein